MKLGVFGVGHLGTIHLKCLQETPWEVVGIYDPNTEAAAKASSSFGVKAYTDPLELIANVDAVDIVSTTVSHHEVATLALEAGKHVFIEKPLADTLDHARLVVDLAEANGLQLQVGHVERYNPAIAAISERGLRPMFIEGHRLTTFNTRGNDVSVVYDLMIHDLDLVLSMVDGPVSDVHANGVCVVNDTPDICNARIAFANGAVANLTASRISMKNMRKLRVFQTDEYISIDLLKKESQIISLTLADEDATGMTVLTSSGKKLVSMEIPAMPDTNPIVEELRDFHKAVKTGVAPPVDGLAGFAAMVLAARIDKAMKDSGL